MRVAIRLVMLLVASAVSAVAFSQPPRGDGDKPAAEAPEAGGALQLHMMDGSTLLGRLTTPHIEVETPFGSLKIPVESVRSFTPGLISHPEVARNISALIEDLGSNQFNQREVAQKELQKMGGSVRLELSRYVDDPDTERRSRVRQMLEELENAAGSDGDDDDGHAPSAAAGGVYVQKDTVETADFTIVGKIVQQSFTVETTYGKFTAKLGDIRRGTRSTANPDARKSLAVPGMSLAPANMMAAGLRVQKGDRVTITAEGTVTMSPWGNQAMTTPDGAPNFGWFAPNEIPNGSLVLRIGNSGPVQKAGSKKTFIADRSGPLYLGMAIQGDYANGNVQFPGEFKVKVVIKRKG